MYRLAIISLIFSYTCLSTAQDQEIVKKILDDFSARFNSFSSIRANFTFTDINLREQTHDRYEGKITFKEKMFRLAVLETETWFDGKTLWNYLPDVNEVNISEPDPEDDIILNNPFNLFASYESRFTFNYRGELSEDGETFHEIDLMPKDLNLEYSRIRIRILTKSLDLLSAKYDKKDGNHYLVEISNIETNLNLPDTYFTFKTSDHPGVEVVDLR
jgi:outer membrane lipoprotein-sorting protein